MCVKMCLCMCRCVRGWSKANDSGERDGVAGMWGTVCVCVIMCDNVCDNVCVV